MAIESGKTQVLADLQGSHCQPDCGGLREEGEVSKGREQRNNLQGIFAFKGSRKQDNSWLTQFL